MGSRSARIEIAGDSLWIPILIIGGVYVPYMARPIRGEILALREKEFVEAAVAQGKGPLRIMLSELLPNLVSTIIVFFTLNIANNMLLESALSFLGAGVQAAQRLLGHDDRRRLPDDLYGAASDHRARVDDRRNGAVAERLRRRPPGRARPAGPRSGWSTRAPMARFIARRLIGMVAVLFAISVIVFLIFNVIPNSDPAARIAGKNANPELIARVSEDLGLR